MVILTLRYVLATAVTLLLPLVVLEFISFELGFVLLVLFGLGACFGRTVGRQSKAMRKVLNINRGGQQADFHSGDA